MWRGSVIEVARGNEEVSEEKYYTSALAPCINSLRSIARHFFAGTVELHRR
jgi:hypothetical protein